MKTLVVAALVLVCAGATTLNVQNNCDDTIHVVRTEGEEQLDYHELSAGDSYSEDYDGGRAMNFKSGLEGKTLAEFTFDAPEGIDYYGLSVTVGFDVGIRLQAPNETLTCFDPDCPDAQPPYEDIPHAVETGGEFTLSFCS
ncbi:unnamed protein product [Bursaphelenchus xylophilus]|uniref:(pine wood nematode) hypothetical protein n=1 Tax=Bursaphelenchus xylophilus TaxID=6326 RepID=A0A1I7RUA6_BURXY|nr:unnamed protein product [Bursaphelenchus xylophilus]CAG9113986.1 unnamed protein product [Bursaphelenchus xylophilus]